jgi:putative transposase
VKAETDRLLLSWSSFQKTEAQAAANTKLGELAERRSQLELALAEVDDALRAVEETASRRGDGASRARPDRGDLRRGAARLYPGSGKIGTQSDSGGASPMLYIALLVGSLRGVLRPRSALLLENLALRQQLAVYQRRGARPRLRAGDRRFWSLLARLWPNWRSPLLFVQPETVIRWHRTAWRRYWTWKSRKRLPGRPRIDPALRQLIHQLARENPRWGVVRIVGELRALGYEVSARTVRRYRQHALRRPPSQSWRTFLHNHASAIWAVDLFTVQTFTLRTVYVLVVIAHGRRRIVHVNVTRHPTAQWIWRQVVEATPWGARPRYLIRDHDRCYGKDFIQHAGRIGITTIVTPIRAPNANAVAERVIGTLRRECLDHLIVLNERHLLQVLREYVEHYNTKRPHRSLALDSPDGRPQPLIPKSGRVVSRSMLGGPPSRVRMGGLNFAAPRAAGQAGSRPVLPGRRTCAPSCGPARGWRRSLESIVHVASGSRISATSRTVKLLLPNESSPP